MIGMLGVAVHTSRTVDETKKGLNCNLKRLRNKATNHNTTPTTHTNCLFIFSREDSKTDRCLEPLSISN